MCLVCVPCCIYAFHLWKRSGRGAEFDGLRPKVWLTQVDRESGHKCGRVESVCGVRVPCLCCVRGLLCGGGGAELMWVHTLKVCASCLRLNAPTKRKSGYK